MRSDRWLTLVLIVMSLALLVDLGLHLLEARGIGPGGLITLDSPAMPDTVRIDDHTFAVTGAFVRDVQSDQLSLRAWAPTPNIRVVQPGNSNQVTVQVENLPTRVRLEASGPVAQERDGLIRTLRCSPKATPRLGFIDALRQVSFAVLGDTGDSLTFIQALRLAASRGADFLIHAGDLIYRDEQMPHIRDILATSPLPVFTVRGNHDYRTTARIAAELRTDSDKGMRMNILETRALTKVFPGRTAVANLNLEVQVGEIFGFLGPNRVVIALPYLAVVSAGTRGFALASCWPWWRMLA